MPYEYYRRYSKEEFRRAVALSFVAGMAVALGGLVLLALVVR